MKASPLFQPSHFSAKTAEHKRDQHTAILRRRTLAQKEPVRLNSAMWGLKKKNNNNDKIKRQHGQKGKEKKKVRMKEDKQGGVER